MAAINKLCQSGLKGEKLLYHKIRAILSTSQSHTNFADQKIKHINEFFCNVLLSFAIYFIHFMVCLFIAFNLFFLLIFLFIVLLFCSFCFYLAFIKFVCEVSLVINYYFISLPFYKLFLHLWLLFIAIYFLLITFYLYCLIYCFFLSQFI